MPKCNSSHADGTMLKAGIHIPAFLIQFLFNKINNHTGFSIVLKLNRGLTYAQWSKKGYVTTAKTNIEGQLNGRTTRLLTALYHIHQITNDLVTCQNLPPWTVKSSKAAQLPRFSKISRTCHYTEIENWMSTYIIW